MSQNAERREKIAVVCEDNAGLAVLIQHLLRKRGFNVRTAANGREGLELIRSASPDLLLLDLAMPETGGLAMLEQMNGFSGKRPYTIVVSGQASQNERDKALALGAQETWRKPFNAAELIGRIDSLVSQGKI